MAGFHNPAGRPDLPFTPVDLHQDPQAWPGGALWPDEFQHADIFTRKGRINNWDYDPEYLEGDFFDLKDIDLGIGDIDGVGVVAAGQGARQFVERILAPRGEAERGAARRVVAGQRGPDARRGAGDEYALAGQESTSAAP